MLKKILIGVPLVAVVLLAGAYGLYKVTGAKIELDGGMSPRFVQAPANFDSLEADRARQRAEAASQTTQTPPAAATGTTVAAAPLDAGATGDATATQQGEGSAASRGYWPDFRGPNRDGRYVETPIRTDWPRGGLPRLWKQPVGLG